MMRAMIVVLALVAGCMDEPAAITPDAGSGVTEEPPPNCPPLPSREGFDFFGEACHSEPDPVVTICRSAAYPDDGWCIHDVCRPQNGLRGTRCPSCPAGTAHISPGGAAYCAP
jgi:hypothetical protein